MSSDIVIHPRERRVKIDVKPWQPVMLVIGATGMLGEPVARQLHADGYKVRLLARDPVKTRARFGDDYEIIEGDVEKPHTLPAALEGCYGVHINLAGGPRPDDYQRIESQGTANVVAAAAGLGIERLTYHSGASVSLKRGWFYHARAKLRAEAAIRESGIPFTILRTSWFMESLPWFIKGNLGLLIGKQQAPLHWLAAQDYAWMVSRCYRTRDSANKVLYLYGPQALSMPEALRIYCAFICPHAQMYTLPPWLVGLVGTLTFNHRLRDWARLMAYFQHITEDRSPTPANSILGAATTSLRQWCAQRRMHMRRQNGAVLSRVPVKAG
jgi:uncharacterized protein YbjT (DUF2867 family)